MDETKKLLIVDDEETLTSVFISILSWPNKIMRLLLRHQVDEAWGKNKP